MCDETNRIILYTYNYLGRNGYIKLNIIRWCLTVRQTKVSVKLVFLVSKLSFIVPFQLRNLKKVPLHHEFQSYVFI